MKKKSEHKVRELCRENYPLLILLVVFSVIIAVCNGCNALVIRKVVDLINGERPEEFKKYLVILTMVFLGSIISQYIYTRLYNKYSYYTSTEIRNNLFRNLIRKRYPDFKKRDVGEYVSMITIDATKLNDGYFLSTITIINNLLNIISSVAIMLVMSLKLSIVVLIISLIPMVVTSLCGHKLPKINAIIIEKNRQFVSFIKEAFSGFHIMKSFMVEDKIFSKFKDVNDGWNKSVKEGGDEGAKIAVFAEGSSQLIVVGNKAIGSIMIYNGLVTFGVIMAFFELLSNILQPIDQLSQNLVLRKGIKPIVVKVIEDSIDIDDTARPLSISGFENSIKLDNVSFSYVEHEPLLKKVSFDIEKNKKYLLAGRSGGGKSTIFDLIRGYYSNYTGNITIDGKEVRNISHESLNTNISIVDQNVFLYNASIRDNITLFCDFPEEKINEAVWMAGLTDLVNRNGLDAQCGENGNLISGGEKQRISIARCLLRDMPILFFDEATSALDNEIASEIESFILSLNVTCFVISHRFNSNILKNYDKIYYIENGCVEESGTYNELMCKRGKFYTQIQATLNKMGNGSDEEMISVLDSSS